MQSTRHAHVVNERSPKEYAKRLEKGNGQSARTTKHLGDVDEQFRSLDFKFQTCNGRSWLVLWESLANMVVENQGSAEKTRVKSSWYLKSAVAILSERSGWTSSYLPQSVAA